METLSCFVIVVFLRRVIRETTVFDSRSESLLQAWGRVTPCLHQLILFNK